MGEEYDPERESSYIIEWDANSLYASVMVEELPIGHFRWASDKVLKDLEKSLRCGEGLPSIKAAFLCVDLDYPEDLHNLHNDYPLAPEKVLINGVEKLAPNLGNKKEYHTSYELLLFYLKKGLILKKVHRAITCKTSAFLKPYIDFCAEKRREAKKRKDKFRDEYWKLAGNAVYGKTFEGVRDRCNTKFVGGGERERLTGLFSQPNFIGSCVLPGTNIVMVQMGKVSVKLNKPIYLAATILDKNKRDMAEFHYDYVLEKWGKERATLEFSDTDILTYHIMTDDVYKDMLPDLEKRFDTSKYPEDHPSGIPKGVNAGAIGGIFKD